MPCKSLNRTVFISGYDFDRRKYGVAGFTQNGQMTSFVPLIGSEMQSLKSYTSLHVDRVDTYYLYLGKSGITGYFINKLSSKAHGIFSVCTTSLKDPQSIISDSVGNMLICDTDTKSVHIIDSEGRVGNTVLTETDDFGPTSMYVNASKDTLIVASRQKESSKITVYKLKYD